MTIAAFSVACKAFEEAQRSHLESRITKDCPVASYSPSTAIDSLGLLTFIEDVLCEELLPFNFPDDAFRKYRFDNDYTSSLECNERFGNIDETALGGIKKR